MQIKKLASELIEEVNLDSAPGLLQNFASAASEHSPEIAKKVIEICLEHPGIGDEQKNVLKTKLKQLQSSLTETPAVSDMGEAHEAVSNAEHVTAELERQLGLKPEVQSGVESEGQSGVKPESQPVAEPRVQPLADSVGQTREELIGQREVNPERKPAVVSEIQYKTQLEGQKAVEPEVQPGAEPESQSGAEPEVQQGVEPDEPERSPAPNQPIMAINATPLNVKDGKIALNMDEIGQQLLPLDKVKSIAIAEIAPDQELPFLLIDLFLDDPKINDHNVRTIRLLSTSFDPTKFSPGIQDKQDALKVFVSVLLKLSGATAYPDEESILLEAPQTFLSIEDYEKSVLS